MNSISILINFYSIESVLLFPFLDVGTSTSSTFWMRVCQKVSFSSSFYSRYYHYPLLIVFCSLWRIFADEISTFWNGTFGDVQWIIPFVSPLPRVLGRLPRVSVRLQVVQSSVHLFPFSCWETSMFRCANSSTKVGRIPFQITACSFSDWEKLCVLCEKYFILWAKALRSKYLALLV